MRTAEFLLKKVATVRSATDLIRRGGGSFVGAAATKFRPVERAIDTGETPHPGTLIAAKAVYRTNLGAAYAADALKILETLPDHSVDAVVTSPPYALHFKKEYGNVDKQDYVQWMLPFARQIKRLLKKDGSFILNIGGSYEAGAPTRARDDAVPRHARIDRHVIADRSVPRTCARLAQAHTRTGWLLCA
jgi:hypothetical protein